MAAYRIDALTPTEFRQTAVPFQFGESHKGAGAWNGERHHHVDAQQVPACKHAAMLSVRCGA